MKKNEKYLIVIAIVGICAFSFLPLTMAGPTTKRPVEDWFYFFPHIFYWLDDDYLLYPYQEVNEYGGIEFKPYWNYEYTGKVTEKDLGDGWVKISAIIQGDDVPFVAYTTAWEPLVFGKLNYLLKYNYALHVETWINWMTNPNAPFHDDDGYHDGRVILPPFPMTRVDPFGIGAFAFENVHITAMGVGTTLTSFLEWESGETVSLMSNIVGMEKDGEYFKPLAFINIF